MPATFPKWANVCGATIKLAIHVKTTIGLIAFSPFRFMNCGTLKHTGLGECRNAIDEPYSSSAPTPSLSYGQNQSEPYMGSIRRTGLTGVTGEVG